MRQNRLVTLVVSFFLLAALLLVSILTACSTPTTSPTPGQTATPTPGQTTTPTAPAGTQELIIGNVGAYTGAYAPNGGPMRDSIRAAVKYYNDRGGLTVAGQNYTIKVLEYDDRNDPKRSVAGITMFKDMYDIKFLIGPFGSQCTLAGQPVCESRQIVEYSAAAADDATREGLKWCWSLAQATKVRALALVPYLANVLKVKTVAMITENEAFCTAGRLAHLDEFKKDGVQVVSDQTFESGTMDFSTVIAKARAANPDLLFVNGVSGTNIIIVKQIYQTGWKVQMSGMVDLVSDDQFRTNGPAAEGIIAMGSFGYWSYKNNLVSEETQKVLGIDLDYYMGAANEYAAAVGTERMTNSVIGFRWLGAYLECMRQAGTISDSVKLRDTFDGMVFQDVDQKTTILPNHRITTYVPIFVYHESSEGATKFDILSVSSHTDEYQLNWTSTVVKQYPTIDEIRKTRGY